MNMFCLGIETKTAYINVSGEQYSGHTIVVKSVRSINSRCFSHARVLCKISCGVFLMGDVGLPTHIFYDSESPNK